MQVKNRPCLNNTHEKLDFLNLIINEENDGFQEILWYHDLKLMISYYKAILLIVTPK